MSLLLKAKHVFGILGLAGFLVCAWFAYECGRSARDSASSAYALWLRSGGNMSQAQAAARQNGLWIVAAAGSLILGLLFLSTAFSGKGAEIRRRGLGILLLFGSCLPTAFAFTISSSWLNVGGRTTPVAAGNLRSWSSGGITLEGWQIYAGMAVFTLAALSMVGTGVYLLTAPAKDEET